MAQTVSTFRDLDPSTPAGTTPAADGDNEIREIKRLLKTKLVGIEDPITATSAQINTASPVGIIVDWYGPIAEIPAGWAYCDGRTVNRTDGKGTITTLDLRDRFIYTSGTLAVGTKGGSQSLSLTTSTNGKHTHPGTTTADGGHSHGGATGGISLSVEHLPSHVHGLLFRIISFVNTALGGPVVTLQVDGAGSETYAAGSGVPHAHPIPADGHHAHAVNLTEAGDHFHTATIADARPPFYVLAKIMRV